MVSLPLPPSPGNVYLGPALFPCRVNQLPSAVLWNVLNAVPAVPGSMADLLPAQILPSKETD